MGVTAIYPGTFDPITMGHIDIAVRACRMFDEVLIAVAKSTPKNTCFSTEERMAMVGEVLADQHNVRVVTMSGLLVERCRELGAQVIVRGIRSVTDFDYEVQMTGMNRQMAPEIDTVFLTPDDRYAHVSSTLVRQIAQLNGDAARFVHPTVYQALQEKFG